MVLAAVSAPARMLSRLWLGLVVTVVAAQTSSPPVVAAQTSSPQQATSVAAAAEEPGSMSVNDAAAVAVCLDDDPATRTVQQAANHAAASSSAASGVGGASAVPVQPGGASGSIAIDYTHRGLELVFPPVPTTLYDARRQLADLAQAHKMAAQHCAAMVPKAQEALDKLLGCPPHPSEARPRMGAASTA